MELVEAKCILRGGWNTEKNVPEVSVGAGVDLRDIMGAGKKRIANLQLDLKLVEAKIYKIKIPLLLLSEGHIKIISLARKRLR